MSRQNIPSPSRATAAWFKEPKLGLFLHWGLYSIEAWHEQDQWRREWSREDYTKLAQRFTARRFDPHHWIDVAEELGARYLCLTTKHADGFCLFDSKHTDYTSVNTPFGRDVVRELSDACHARGMPLFLYYSIVDEHHHAYPHAGRRWEYPVPQPGDKPSKKNYLEYLKAQVTELCTNYGKIHGFWWDANPAAWRDPSINTLIRKLQPGIVINNRGFDAGDFGTPERDWDESVNTELVFTHPTEACQALGSQSWGHRKEEDYYTCAHLARSIAKIRGKGGHYLLNTGPRPDGTINLAERRTLRKLGGIFRATREAFEGVKRVSDLISTRDALLTRKDAKTWYVILHKQQTTRAVPLKPFTSLPVRATELTTGKPVKTRNDLLPWDHEHHTGFLRLYDLPETLLNNTAPVIKLEFDKPPRRARLEKDNASLER
ncbi:MAG: alpha-L-fucosidase [Verrucomicrobia bacterium]|nr:alpha-L-fucosidase [Verrucomicrobiota bacterium]MCH8525619.1 alpha-L-fucosidase [Kiritimatiellia bacterium]